MRHRPCAPLVSAWKLISKHNNSFDKKRKYNENGQLKYIVSALPFLFTACSGDWLDLDPSTSVTSDNAIQSLEDAKTALNGIYRIASEHSYYGDNYLYYADCRGEDVQARIDKGPGRRVSPYYLFNVAADDALISREYGTNPIS